MFEWVIRMLQYDRIDISEGIDINKSNKSKECILCYYCYFKDIGYQFELLVCNGFQDVLMTAYELRNIAMLNVKGVHYRCILWGISKDKHCTKNEVFHYGFLHFLCSGSS